MRAAPVRAALVALLVLLLGLGGYLLLTDDGPGAARRPGGVDATERDAAVRAVLDRRAAAVLAQDRTAFLADVDRSHPGAVAAQERLFANLAQVEFASWEYELVGRDYARPDLAATYDRPYYLPALLLHYAIEGFDVAPVARPHVLTFVQRGGRWLVADDRDADADLPETGHADPWDRRAMLARSGERVLVLADAQDRAQLPELVAAAETAVGRVADLWLDGWRRRVVVVAVRDPQLVETYFRSARQSSANVAAIAVPALDWVPGWSGRAARDREAELGPRSRVVLNPRSFDPSDDRNVDVLTHEVTHVATQARTRAGAPAWLTEGAAEYTAYRHLRPFSVRLPASLRHQVEAGSVELPTYDFWTGDVAAHYLAGFLACAHVADEYGESTLRRLHDRLARTAREAELPARQDAVLRALLGVSTEQFRQDVAAYGTTVLR